MILSLILSAILFLIPSNLFYVLSESTAYVHGLRVDYLLPKLYLTDILILGLLGWWLLQFVLKKKSIQLAKKIKKSVLPTSTLILLGLGVLLTGSQVLSSTPLVSAWFSFKIWLLVWFGWWLLRQKWSNWFFAALIAGILFQSILGIYQFYSQSSFAGYFFLGEPDLSSYAGIAKGNFHNQVQILPYGTTSHPNVLAGYLVISLLLALISVRRVADQNAGHHSLRQGSLLVSAALGGYVLFLTQSVSAWLSLGLGLAVLALTASSFWEKCSFSTRQILLTATFVILSLQVLAPFLLLKLQSQIPSMPSIERRVMLNQAAWDMFLNQPLQGLGFGSFTKEVETFSNQPEIVRFVQPAHHLGLLLIAETGILGVSLVVSLLLFVIRKIESTSTKTSNIYTTAALTFGAALTPIAVLDHYLLTNQTGWFLILLILFFVKHQTTQDLKS